MRRRARAAAAGLAVAVLVAAVLFAATRPDPEAPASSGPLRSPDHGFAIGATALFESEEELARDLDGIAATRADWLRIDLYWDAIEPREGRFDWARTDVVIDAARRRGMQVLAVPAYTPDWARPEGTTDKHPPDDPETFVRFVRAAVERYRDRGVRHWEIWNEANTSSFWQPQPDAAAYAELLRVAADAIHDVDPDATVLTAGTAPADDADDGSTIAPTTFLRTVYEVAGSDAFDAVAHHPYSYPVRPLFASSQNAFAATIPALREVMADNGDDDKELWATEFGVPTGSNERAVPEDEQPAHLREALEAWLDTPGTGPIFWYSWRDAGDDDGDLEHRFGVVRRDRSPRPLLDAMARAIDGWCAAEPSPCR